MNLSACLSSATAHMQVAGWGKKIFTVSLVHVLFDKSGVLLCIMI